VKSKATSRSRKTGPPETPAPSAEAPPLDPVQGAGGLQFLIYAAATFPNDKFADYYAERAAHLRELHAGAPGAEVALERLLTLI
jgi:hypothetical protein